MSDEKKNERRIRLGDGSDTIVVMITCPADVAEKLAETLVEEQLAACVNIIEGMQSVYRWEGKIQKDREALLVVKTATSRYRNLESRTREIHPYSCPEIIALQIADGFADYLRWIRAETNQTSLGEEKR